MVPIFLKSLADKKKQGDGKDLSAEIDSLLVDGLIYRDVKRKAVASADDLKRQFGTSNLLVCAEEIVVNGKLRVKVG